MERYMKSERLGIDPNKTDADKTYKHWFQTLTIFSNRYLQAIPQAVVNLARKP